MAKDIKNIEKKVIEILAEKLNIKAEKIKPESKLADDLGMDSFGAVEVMFEVEEKFGVTVSDKELIGLKTVEDVVKYVENKT